MANQRAKDKVNLTVWVTRKFARAFSAAADKAGENYSDFIRKAIAERLAELGIPYDERDTRSPSRARRDFNEPVADEECQGTPLQSDGTPVSSDVAAAAAALGEAATAEVEGVGEGGCGPSGGVDEPSDSRVGPVRGTGKRSGGRRVFPKRVPR